MFEITNILLQYLGFISIISIIGTGYLMIKNDPHTYHSSVSSYAGSAKSQARLAFIALIVFSVPFYIWILFWLIPSYELSSLLYPFVIISFICHILLVRFPLIPSNGKRHIGNLLHLVAGAVIAINMLGIVGILSLSPAVMEMIVAKIILFALSVAAVTFSV